MDDGITIRTMPSHSSKKHGGSISLIAAGRYGSKKPPSQKQNFDPESDHGTLGFARIPVQVFQGKSYFGCHLHRDESQPKYQNCEICKLQIDDPKRFEERKDRQIKLYKHKDISFQEFIKFLLPPKETQDLDGCEMIFSDTCFLSDDNKPIFIAKTVGEDKFGQGGKLTKFDNPLKLTLGKVRQEFFRAVESRKADKEDIKDKMMNQTASNQEGSQSLNGQVNSPQGQSMQKSFKDSQGQKKTSFLGNKSGGKGMDYSETNQMTGNFSQSLQGGLGGGPTKKKEKVTLWQKDDFIFRYRESTNPDVPGGQVKVLENKQFLQLTNKLKSDKNWNGLELIQTCIKADGGCGDPVILHFFAPLDEQNPENEINYNYKEMEPDVDLLTRGEDQKYVLKQCLKYCYYAQKVHSKEILQMKAEFFKDMNGKIWFFYARGIQCRDCPNTKVLNVDKAKNHAQATEENKKAVRLQMIEELEAYEVQMKNQKHPTIDRMKSMMNEYYQNLKIEAKIEDQTGLDDEDYELDGILRTLKPNTTAKNFKEFLKPEDNCLKSQAWRQISRAVYKAEELEKKRQRELVDPEIDPTQMKVQSLVNAFTNNCRASNQPMLIEPINQKLLNSIVQSQEEKRANELIMRQPKGDPMAYNYDAKDAAQIKAELIRRNLLSRKDLMQLYRPPLKKSQVARNNPFIAKSMVGADRSISAGFSQRDIQSAIVRVSNTGQGGKLDGGYLMPPIQHPQTSGNSQSNLRQLFASSSEAAGTRPTLTKEQSHSVAHINRQTKASNRNVMKNIKAVSSAKMNIHSSLKTGVSGKTIGSDPANSRTLSAVAKNKQGQVKGSGEIFQQYW